MQRLGKNHGGYFGETIDIDAVLRGVDGAARRRGWSKEIFHDAAGAALMAMARPPLRPTDCPLRVYVSSGIHGDEPAGPLAIRRLLEEDRWPAELALWCCPCLNPAGFRLNRRDNGGGVDLNRRYRHLDAAETRAHVAWLERQPAFDLCLCLHEDWESNGFYLYELNPDHRPSLAEAVISSVAPVCPIDYSERIEGREARGGIIRPNLDPSMRPEWAEAFYLIVNKTRLSYTLEAPSDFALPARVEALAAGVNAALGRFVL
jgi:hypothetical protein